MAVVAFAVAVSLGMIKLPKRSKEPLKTVHIIEKWYGERASHETLSAYFNRLQEKHPKQSTLNEVKELVEKSLYQPEMTVPPIAFKVLLRKLNQQRQ
jgi:hypothetical protein